MAKVYEFLATGFEEIEALAPVDILRRGGVEIKTVSISETEYVVSAHGVTIKADMIFTKPEDYADADMLLLPGGMPGASNLNAHEGVRKALLLQNKAGKRIGAICAGPMVLGSLGLLNGRKATCYPGFEKFLTGAEYTAALFEEDGNIITGEGPAAVLPYSYRILTYFAGEDESAQVQRGMLYDLLMETH
ncbi:MAG: DJ-1 family glyoxalase III [Prevotella sp.]|nr:DJ-1/PfpI family protein [Prevotella sp.]